MSGVDPKDLKPGDWFVWHELKPVRYRVVGVINDGRIIAEDEHNLRVYESGVFPPASVSVDDRRFERVPPPEDFRRPLPDEIGTTIIATAPALREDGPTLLQLCVESVYGPKWVEAGSGEWVSPGDIHDWRLVDGLDTVRPEQDQP